MFSSFLWAVYHLLNRLWVIQWTYVSKIKSRYAFIFSSLSSPPPPCRLIRSVTPSSASSPTWLQWRGRKGTADPSSYHLQDPCPASLCLSVCLFVCLHDPSPPQLVSSVSLWVCLSPPRLVCVCLSLSVCLSVCHGPYKPLTIPLCILKHTPLPFDLVLCKSVRK